MLELNPPLIVHVHVPKTAGQSFLALLEENFGDRHGLCYDDNPDHIFDVPELENIVFNRPELMGISSHGIRVFPRTLAGRPALYITFLREPTETFISLIKFVRRTFASLHPAAKTWWPENTPLLSIRELVAHYLRYLGGSSQACLQTRFFCHPSNFPQLVGYDLNYNGFNSFTRAAKTLDDFLLVGIVEEFEKSLELLRHKLLPYDIDFRWSKIPNVNQSPASSDETTWVTEGDEIGKALLTGNVNDHRLYERYLNKLRAEHTSLTEPTKVIEDAEHAVVSLKQEDAGTASALFSDDEPLRAIAEFSSSEYRRLNARRLEHLCSLGLPLTGKKVWEVSAGIGDLTSFFLDRQCEVTISDVRPVLLEILRDRFPRRPIERVDLASPSMDPDSSFDIVFCYGVLYHVEDPSLMLAFLASKCQAMLLLETCVSPGDELAINPVEEDKHFFSQAFHGLGCRPTRRYVFEELKKHFAFVYITAEQPRHEQFPVEWDDSVRKQRFIRSVFVAARCPLNNPKLLDQIPFVQRAHS